MRKRRVQISNNTGPRSKREPIPPKPFIGPGSGLELAHYKRVVRLLATGKFTVGQIVRHLAKHEEPLSEPFIRRLRTSLKMPIVKSPIANPILPAETITRAKQLIAERHLNDPEIVKAMASEGHKISKSKVYNIRWVKMGLSPVRKHGSRKEKNKTVAKEPSESYKHTLFFLEEPDIGKIKEKFIKLEPKKQWENLNLLNGKWLRLKDLLLGKRTREEREVIELDLHRVELVLRAICPSFPISSLQKLGLLDFAKE